MKLTFKTRLPSVFTALPGVAIFAVAVGMLSAVPGEEKPDSGDGAGASEKKDSGEGDAEKKVTKEVVTVEIAGLRVVGDGYGEGAARILPLNWRRGTTVALMVHSGGSSVLDLDPMASELEVFEDDKGTDLLPDPKTSRPAFGLYPMRSEDRKAALVEIWGDALAESGAREIRIKGTLALTVGKGRQAVQTVEITPRAGAAAELGKRMVSILSGLPFPDESKSDGDGKEKEKDEEAKTKEPDDKKKGADGGKDKGGEDEEEKTADEKDENGGGGEEDGILSIRISGEPEEVANLKILDEESEPLAVKFLGVRVIRRDGVRAIHRFQLPEGFDGDIVIAADLWEERETIRVLFEKTVSVGLGTER